MSAETCCDPNINSQFFLPSKIMMVAAVVLINPKGEILLAKRLNEKHKGGLWEFPGGKVQEQEAPEATAVREIKEEIGIDICPGCLFPLTFASYPYEDFHLVMLLYGCRQFEAESIPVKGREGQLLQWVMLNTLNNYPMPEANRLILGTLHDLL